MGNLVHESDQKRERIEVAVDGNPVAIFCGWRPVITEFCQTGIFYSQLDFVFFHQIGGIQLTALWKVLSQDGYELLFVHRRKLRQLFQGAFCYFQSNRKRTGGSG